MRQRQSAINNLQSAIALGLLFVPLAALVFFLVLTRPSGAPLERASGTYAAEGGDERFRWSGSHVVAPLDPHSGPTLVRLRIGAETWPGRASPTHVQLAAGDVTAELQLTGTPRVVQFLAPPAALTLHIDTPVARPPGVEQRWLGVQLYDLRTIANGWPLRQATVALLLALLLLAGLLLFYRLSRAGYATLALITVAGFALRVYRLPDSPPGLHRDEVVSLVDAWSLLHTGRDHLGHLLPLASFEAYGDWISPLLTYLEVPAVALLGPGLPAARGITVLVGTLAIPLAYALARTLGWPRVAGLAAALVTALSPWQIFLSRVAIPPALAPASWMLCLLAAASVVARGRRSDALWLALACGLGLYTYPTMKLAVPLLLVLAVVLCGIRWRRTQPARERLRVLFATYAPAVALLALLWLPFVVDLLANPNGGDRFAQIGLSAATPLAWLGLWLRNYLVYWLPDLYYITGDTRKIIRGVPGHGVALLIEAPLVLAGLVALLGRVAGINVVAATQRHSRLLAALLLGAILIAPLPASLTNSNPHVFRAAMVAPGYALLAGIGAAVLWALLGRLPRHWPEILRPLGALALVVVLSWQSWSWYHALLDKYPSQAALTWFYADNELEAMRRVVAHAADYDQVLIDDDSIGRPYIYLLAAGAMPAAEAQAAIEVQRQPREVNIVRQLGRYHFADLSSQPVPLDLPAIEVIPERFGGAGYVLQEWQRGPERILVVRGTGGLAPAEPAD